MEPIDQQSIKVSAQNAMQGTVVAEKYELIELLGSGAAGSVYKAKQSGLSRLVAIKVLHQHHVHNERVLMRFQQEAEAISRLVHTNIVPLFDFGTMDNGVPYIVMELQTGKCLDEFIKSDKPAVAELLSIFRQIAAALQYAHSRGVIHRDIKPSNILVSRESDGTLCAKVADFGLAKVADNDVQLTDTGDTLGTPLYMSPEQCRGQALDARSDIYSLGCVMYEAFTGKPVVSGETYFDCMSRHLTVYPDRFSKVATLHQFPAGLENLVFRCISKNRDDRYPTAAALEEDLQSVAAGAGAKIKRARLRVPDRTKGLLVPVAVVVIAVAVSAMLVMKWTGSSGQQGAEPNAVSIDSLDDLAKRASTEGNYQECERLLLLAKKQAQLLGHYSKSYIGHLEKLRELYAATKQNAKLADVERELETIDINFKYGTTEGNAHRIAKLMILTDREPDNDKAAIELCTTLNNQIKLLCIDQRYKEASDFAQKALLLEKKHKMHGLESGQTYLNLAILSYLTGDRSKSAGYFAQALELADPDKGRDFGDLRGRIYRDMALLHFREKQFAQAEKELALAKDLFSSTFGPNSRQVVICDTELAQVSIAADKFAAAAEYLKQAEAINAALPEVAEREKAMIYHYSGLLHAKQGDLLAAEESLRKSLAIVEHEYEPTDPMVADALFELATVLQAQQRVSEAEPLFSRAKNIRAGIAARIKDQSAFEY